MDAFVDTQQTQSPRMAAVNGWQHPNTVEENRVTHWLESDLETMEQRFRAKLINSIAGFKPALLVGTVDTLGRPNLAVFSTIFHVGSAPPLLGLLVRPAPDKTERHTLENILAAKAYTFNHFPAHCAQAAHQTSARYPQGQSEFAAAGFTAKWQAGFAAPFVADTSIQLGMALVDHQVLINSTHLLIGHITHLWVADDLIRGDGSVDLVKADSTVVAGLDSYHSVNAGQRFSYAKVDGIPTPID